jgi:hypothetical protein
MYHPAILNKQYLNHLSCREVPLFKKGGGEAGGFLKIIIKFDPIESLFFN